MLYKSVHTYCMYTEWQNSMTWIVQLGRIVSHTANMNSDYEGVVDHTKALWSVLSWILEPPADYQVLLLLLLLLFLIFPLGDWKIGNLFNMFLFASFHIQEFHGSFLRTASKKTQPTGITPESCGSQHLWESKQPGAIGWLWSDAPRWFTMAPGAGKPEAIQPAGDQRLLGPGE